MDVVKVGGEIFVNTQTAGGQVSPTTTGLTNGGFVVTWQDAGSATGDISAQNIKTQLFDASGAKVGSEFLVNTQTANTQYAPTITGLTNGGFVVTWYDYSGTLGDPDGGIKAQIFDASGAKVGSEFLVNTQTASEQLSPTITGLTTGGFVVTWYDQSGTLGDNSGVSIKAQVFNANGAKTGTEFLVNTQTAADQITPTITGLTNGGFVVTWHDYSGTLGDNSGASIKAQVFNASGVKVGSEFLVNTQTASDQRSPTITGLTNGGFVVTWYDASGTLGDNSGTSVKAQVFDATGVKVGSEFLVNTQTFNHQQYPTITGLTNGGFVVTWHDYSGTLGDSSGLSIKAQVFDASGVKVGTEFLVNTQTTADQTMPTITGLTNGRFVVTWQDWSGNPSDAYNIKAQVFVLDEPPVNSVPATATASADGFIYFSPSRNTAITVSDADGDSLTTTLDVSHGTLSLANTAGLTSVSGNGSGHLVIAGSTANLNAALDGLIYQAAAGYGSSDQLTIATTDGVLTDTDVVTISDRFNVPFGYAKVGGEIRLDIANPAGGNHQYPTVAGLTDGNFVATWRDLEYGSLASIDAALHDASGARVSGFLISGYSGVDHDQLSPSVAALANGGFVVTWEYYNGVNGDTSGASILAELKDASGAFLTYFPVNTQTAGDQVSPTVTGLTNGGFVVTWQDQSGTLGDSSGASIKAQVFNAAGAKVGTEFLVNTQTANDQLSPTITGLTNGGFVVTWQDQSGTLGDNSSTSIKAQLFDATGVKVGGEFLVNTETASDQLLPTVTALTNGGFVVTWQDQSGTLGDSLGTSIKAQLFDASGAKVGSEFLVNTQTAGDQAAPAIAALTNGGFAVTWYENVSSPGGNIVAQVFDATGAKFGSQFLVNTQSQIGEAPTIAGLANGGFVVTWRDLSGSIYTVKSQVFAADLAPFATNLNASETYTEDAVFNLTDIVISDTDSANVTATLTLSNAAAGALSTATSGSVISTYNANTGVWSAQGAIADVNALLAGLTFTPSPNFNSSFNIAAGITDAVSTITGSKAFVGTPVNDAPEVANPIANQSSPEGAAWNFTFAVNTFSDVDGDTLTYTATLANGDPLPGWLHFSSATRTFSGTPLGFNGSLDLEVTASDGTEMVSETFALAVTPTNDAPWGADTTKTILEDFTHTFAIADFGFTDVDGNALAGVKITTVPLVGLLTLDNVAFTADQVISAADITAGKLKFAPAANASGFGYASFTFQVQDDGGTVNGGVDLDPSPNTFTFNVTPQNDLPVVTASAGSTVATERVPTVIDSGITVSDVDDFLLIAAEVRIVGNFHSGEDLLAFDNTDGTGGHTYGGISATYDGATGVLSLSATAASVGQYQAALQHVIYTNTSHGPSTANRTIQFTVRDDDDWSAGATRTVSVTAVNDAPVVSGPATLAAIEEDSGARLITQAELLANASDADGPSLTAVNLQIAAGAGTLVDSNNGTWSFTPAHDDDTSVTFSYQVTDSTASVATSAKLDITSVDDAAPITPGTTGSDSFDAPSGDTAFDAGLGVDTIKFGFKLTDAMFTWSGNQVTVTHGADHTVLSGFERFVFDDGTVENNDANPLVDDLFYYANRHDVWAAHVDADQHFEQYGWKEGSDPNAFFDTSLYLALNPAARTAGANPLTQFDQSGWKNGAIPSLNFDPVAYLAAYPDVKAAGIDPLLHFLQHGFQENRSPFTVDELMAPSGFDSAYYLRSNPDVAAAGVDPLQHFQQYGWKEGRNPNALFDTQGYLATYGDVKAAGINPLDHYNTFGWKEGRDPSPSFDSSSYLVAYADVKAAGIDPLLHYLDYGRHEGRSAFADGMWG
jgi:hypothetical protein